MKVTERRNEILNILRQSEVPVAAKELAVRFNVSRQVIVQDMAVIRASNSGIVSTYTGYIMQSNNSCCREFKVNHNEDQAASELNLIVDCGGKIKNVSINHCVYGRITAELDVCSRQDVNEFVQALNCSKSTLLGSATSGYHYHLVEASSEQRLDTIESKLQESGFLIPSK